MGPPPAFRPKAENHAVAPLPVLEAGDVVEPVGARTFERLVQLQRPCVDDHQDASHLLGRGKAVHLPDVEPASVRRDPDPVRVLRHFLAEIEERRRDDLPGVRVDHLHAGFHRRPFDTFAGEVDQRMRLHVPRVGSARVVASRAAGHDRVPTRPYPSRLGCGSRRRGRQLSRLHQQRWCHGGELLLQRRVVGGKAAAVHIGRRRALRHPAGRHQHSGQHQRRAHLPSSVCQCFMRATFVRTVAQERATTRPKTTNYTGAHGSSARWVTDGNCDRPHISRSQGIPPRHIGQT